MRKVDDEHEVVFAAGGELDDARIAVDEDRAPVTSLPKRARRRESLALRSTPIVASQSSRPRNPRRSGRPPSTTSRSALRRFARSARGEARKISRQARLNWRKLPKPVASAISSIGRSVSSSRRRAKCARAERANPSGVTPRLAAKSRRRCRGDTPSRAPSCRSFAGRARRPESGAPRGRRAPGSVQRNGLRPAVRATLKAGPEAVRLGGGGERIGCSRSRLGAGPPQPGRQ